MSKSQRALHEEQIRDTQKCKHCKNFAWHHFMQPIRKSFFGDWHHPACPQVADRSDGKGRREP